MFSPSSADVSSNFSQRYALWYLNIEAQIKAKMGDVLLKQGIIVESVLMKSIQLPVV
jgi:hypothetical protein